MQDNFKADISAPLGRKTNFLARMLKKALKYQGVKHIAFMAGLRGFNRVGSQILRFKGIYEGQRLWVDQFLMSHADNEAIPEGQQWVYSRGFLDFVYNSRVNAGAALQASVMSGSTLGGLTSPLPPNKIALSTTSLTPAATDTTLTGETALSGLARIAGTVQNYVAPGSLDGAASYDCYHQFTAGAAATIQSTALFDATSAGNMFAEVNFSSSATLAINDILQVTWTVNI